MSSFLHMLRHHRGELEAAQHLDAMNSGPVLFQRVLAKGFWLEKKGKKSKASAHQRAGVSLGRASMGCLCYQCPSWKHLALKTPHLNR